MYALKAFDLGLELRELAHGPRRLSGGVRISCIFMVGDVGLVLGVVERVEYVGNLSVGDEGDGNATRSSLQSLISSGQGFLHL